MRGRRRPPPRLAAAAALRLRSALLRLADHAIPPRLALYDRSMSVGRTHVLAAVAELGIADALDGGPATAEELARRLDVDADALHRVLRAAAVEGVVRLDRHGAFRLTRLGGPLRAREPGSARDWLRYMGLAPIALAWADLPVSIRSGASGFRRVNGASQWKWLAARPDLERLFAAAMREVTEELAPAVVAGYPWPASGVVCDVAGGTGSLLAAILARRPRLRGALLEADGVLPEAARTLAAAGVRDRVELVAGDMFERIGVSAEVYLLKDVMHDWDDAACVRILARVREAMPRESRVVLVETLQERNRPDPIASLLDVHMLTTLENGRQRSGEELCDLLAHAGLEPAGVRRTAGPALVVGTAAGRWSPNA